MTDDALTWLPDGFHLELDRPEDETSPLGQVLALYALCAPPVTAALLNPALLPLLGSLLLPLPTALLWTALRPRRIRIRVDHQRIQVRGPFGGQRTIELRRVRDVNLRVDGLELVLQDGARVALHAPASTSRLAWLADRIGELRDEVVRFEAELRQRTADVMQVTRLARKARER